MLDECVDVHLFVMSHHLVLLPRSLEVQAAVLSVLNDCPSTAGCFHVAIHLHSGDRNERRSVGKPVFEHIRTLTAPIGLLLFFIKTKKRFLTSRRNIPTLSVTLSGFNRQWKANCTIVRCQTLLFSPAFMTTHLQERDAFLCPPQALIAVSLNSSPEMFLTGGASVLQDQSWGSRV